jgi:hypothetical protein
LFSFRKAKGQPTLQPAREVVTAIIDDGLAFVNEHFRKRDGSTRVEYVWNQDGPLYPPPFFDYGLESQKANTSAVDGIDTTIGICSRDGLLDEDQFYQRTGHLSFGQSGHKPIGWRGAHGLMSWTSLPASRLPTPLLCVPSSVSSCLWP